ncbi:MAG: Ty1/Copia family ribonuclease HI, partial [Bacteroidota bacterium]
ALSTAEAEFDALTQTTKEIMLIAMKLDELQINYNTPIRIKCDNTAAIKLAKIHGGRPRTKHVGFRFEYVRQKYQEGLISVEHVTTLQQTADIMTKSLPAGLHLTHLNSLLREVPDEEEA